MKRKHLKWYITAAALAVMFVGYTIYCYTEYIHSFTSFPFWCTILVNAVMFLLPALIFAGIGLLTQYSNKKEKSHVVVQEKENDSQ